MIILKQLINENRERSHCWMSPSGKIIPVTDTHMTTAIQLIPNWKEQRLDPMAELWKKGYLRVTYMYDGSLMVNNEKQLPTEKQMSILKQIAMEDGHDKIIFDNGEENKTLWSNQDQLEESSVQKSEVEFLNPDEVSYDKLNDLERIERESGIRILRNKELNTVALQNGNVVGALYIENNGYEFSFDLFVDKPARGQGIGAKLIDIALSQYAQEESEMGTELRVDVVNPWVEKYLLHKGLKVLQKIGNHTIMTTRDIP